MKMLKDAGILPLYQSLWPLNLHYSYSLVKYSCGLLYPYLNFVFTTAKDHLLVYSYKFKILPTIFGELIFSLQKNWYLQSKKELIFQKFKF